MIRMHSGEKGLTLVEMMAALTIALLVIGIAFTIRQFSERTERDIHIQSGLQEQVRLLEQLIVPLVQDSQRITPNADGTEIVIEQTDSTGFVTIAELSWDPNGQTLLVKRFSPPFQKTFEHVSEFSYQNNIGVAEFHVTFQDRNHSFDTTFSATPRMQP
ncbi:hypothetical protein EFBL_0106 [Effusibacillus lacus]|uniref:Prepilin-type N-terminal cleavage/methylation domain-containing protein n=2 Tax=Effusibacillus lacus TaxID=1348429 RepID=A0A292YF69_9BACL|nr:hypothetical protein EFBL_0106 [Effusibacillus lacus]